MVEASDNWYPNFNADGKPDEDGHLVRLTLLEFSDHAGWRVCVWGADDTGVERDFSVLEKSEAQELFKLIQGCGPVSCSDLLAIGFINA